MKPINEAAVTFLSRSANEGFARTAAGGFAAPRGPPPRPYFILYQRPLYAEHL